MKEHTANQQKTRKRGGSSSFVDSGTPSRAPRQDEDVSQFTGPGQPSTPTADKDSEQQGISNRPAKEEHAFPQSGVQQDNVEAPDSVETDSKQMGGHRGRV